MLKYITVKCVGAVLTLFIVALCTFLLARVIPGGPFDGEKQQPPQVKEWQERKYGFNNPPLLTFLFI
jgi:oligopeptide transport system permease protein